jgi:hypothetical protein
MGIGVEYMLRRIPNDFSYKKQLVETKGAEMRNMIIGSSVVDYGIDPLYLPDSTYNLAIAGQWIPSNAKMLKTFYSYTPNIKVLIWGISVQSLWIDYEDSGLVYFPSQEETIAYEQIYLNFELDSDPIHRSEFLSALHPSCLKLNKYYLKNDTTMYCDSLGFDHKYSCNRSKKGWDADSHKNVDGFVRCEDNHAREIFSTHLQMIEDVLSFSYEKGIRVYLVMPPIYKGLAKSIPTSQFQDIDNAMNALAQKWSNCSWHDYSRDTRFDKDDFFDRNHLNAERGAVKFSKILNDDLFDNNDKS